MRKIIFQFFIFVSIIVCSDFIIGTGLKKLYFKKPSYSNAKIIYSIDSSSQDILIYGSSRAQHHYIPDTITKYTGLSCYNCGIGGQGLTFSYIQIAEMLKRHKPKLIILDISPNIMIDSNSNEKLRVLSPYYTRDTLIQNVLNSLSHFEKFKYYSSIYPYNGDILSIISSFFYFKKENAKGFIPLSGKLNPCNLKINNGIQPRINSSQLNFMNLILRICKNSKVPLVFMISPIFKKNKVDFLIIDQVKHISNEFGEYFVDYSSDSTLNNNSNMYKDNLHLNSYGASLYSKTLCNELSLLQNKLNIK